MMMMRLRWELFKSFVFHMNVKFAGFQKISCERFCVNTEHNKCILLKGQDLGFRKQKKMDGRFRIQIKNHYGSNMVPQYY